MPKIMAFEPTMNSAIVEKKLQPLDPNNPWKNEGFTPPNMGFLTPKNEGNLGSHGNGNFVHRIL